MKTFLNAAVATFITGVALILLSTPYWFLAPFVAAEAFRAVGRVEAEAEEV